MTPRRALRVIAAFEAGKGILALAASLGLLSLLHRDLHLMAVSLIGHVGLDPGGQYPAMLLSDIDRWSGADLRTVLLLAWVYSLVRGLEAIGLWKERPWGEGLGALSGALYIPFELRHFVHQPSAIAAGVIAFNVLVVGFLAWQLRKRQRSQLA